MYAAHPFCCAQMYASHILLDHFKETLVKGNGGKLQGVITIMKLQAEYDGSVYPSLSSHFLSFLTE